MACFLIVSESDVIVLDCKNKSEVPRVHFLKKKIDWDNPEKGLLNSINAIYQTTSRELPRGFW